jgi:hypothetical protein
MSIQNGVAEDPVGRGGVANNALYNAATEFQVGGTAQQDM